MWDDLLGPFMEPHLGLGSRFFSPALPSWSAGAGAGSVEKRQRRCHQGELSLLGCTPHLRVLAGACGGREVRGPTELGLLGGACVGGAGARLPALSSALRWLGRRCWSAAAPRCCTWRAERKARGAPGGAACSGVASRTARFGRWQMLRDRPEPRH